MDKIDLIINSKFIGSQQTHRKKRVTSNRSPRDHCIENQKERRSHLVTAYRPVGLQWTTHASSGRHQWGWWIPSWWCLDWICGFWNLRRLELCFVDSPRVFWIFGVHIEKRGGAGGGRGGHNPPGHVWTPRHARWAVLPLEPPLVLLWPNRCLLV